MYTENLAAFVAIEERTEEDLNNRERMDAVVYGKQRDRLPFVTYNDNAAPNDEIWQALGRDSMALLRGTYIHQIVSEGCKITTEPTQRNGREGLLHTLHTPWGNLTEVHLKQYELNTYAYVKHYCETKQDLEILLKYFKASKAVPHFEYWHNNIKSVGDDGIVICCVERTPYQQMWILWMNLMDLCYMMEDEPDIIEACMAEIGRLLDEQIEIVANAVKEFPMPLVEFPENLTAPCIGAELFEKYSMPYYKKLKDRIGDTMLGVHADGDTKSLAPLIAKSGLDFLESFTPAPDNDLTMEEACKLWPDMAFFINFTSSVHLDTPEVIYQTAMDIYKACEGRKMWIQASESVPPGVWKKSYPEIIRATKQFK